MVAMIALKAIDSNLLKSELHKMPHKQHFHCLCMGFPGLFTEITLIQPA